MDILGEKIRKPKNIKTLAQRTLEEIRICGNVSDVFGVF
jgi:hypothetical protein